MILEIAYYGNPILRKKALPVTDINNEIKQLVKDMIETMDLLNGLGLAAPQIKKSLRLFVTRECEFDESDRAHMGDVKVYINPSIISLSENFEFDTEGCLSIPKIFEEVERPIGVVVEAMNLKGETFREELYGLKARAILHENDHLNGVLFVDRLDKYIKKDIAILLSKIKKKYN